MVTQKQIGQNTSLQINVSIFTNYRIHFS